MAEKQRMDHEETMTLFSDVWLSAFVSGAASALQTVGWGTPEECDEAARAMGARLVKDRLAVETIRDSITSLIDGSAVSGSVQSFELDGDGDAKNDH